MFVGAIRRRARAKRRRTRLRPLGLRPAAPRFATVRRARCGRARGAHRAVRPGGAPRRHGARRRCHGGRARGSAAALAVDELIATVCAPLFVLSAERWPGTRNILVVARRVRRGCEQRALWRAALAGQPNSVNGELDAITQQFDLVPTRSRTWCRAPGATRQRDHRTDLWDGVSRTDRRGARRAGASDHPATAGTTSWSSDDVRGQLRELAAQVRAARPGVRVVGIRRATGSRPRNHRAVRRPERHRQDDGRRDPRGASRARPVPHRPRRGREQVHRRNGEEPAPRVRRGRAQRRDPASSTRRTRCSASGRRCATATTGTRTWRSTTSSSGWRTTPGSRSSRRTAVAALDAAFLRRLRFVIDFPFPGVDDRRRIWERVFPPQAAVEGLDQERSVASGSERRQHPDDRDQRGVPRRGGRCARSACRTSCGLRPASTRSCRSRSARPSSAPYHAMAGR